ncbi:MAG TPA: anthranilate phosphoribosyltransferase, partial [Sphingomonas sp.]|nr:anthranilate phosphoribosyltransferase [Sphingomonas sp.]
MTTFSLLPDPATPLARESAAQAFADILDGTVAEPEIERFLIALSERGETSIEIAE